MNFTFYNIFHLQSYWVKNWPVIKKCDGLSQNTSPSPRTRKPRSARPRYILVQADSQNCNHPLKRLSRPRHSLHPHLDRPCCHCCMSESSDQNETRRNQGKGTLNFQSQTPLVTLSKIHFWYLLRYHLFSHHLQNHCSLYQARTC